MLDTPDEFALVIYKAWSPELYLGPLKTIQPVAVRAGLQLGENAFNMKALTAGLPF